ncbi:MAG: helix-turn-helix domain-containing protein [Saprospiraceae bacterium]|nr:helix-turn-helix domain-containing protein [Saprospiraceae bacterium]
METNQHKTIAVLPFANMSASDENEYFVDGITEEIINALAKIDGLRVTSRTSSFFFKEKNIPIAEIGRELNVSTILEGSARLAGDMIRITAQLIQAEEDFHFWSETWDRKLDNIFEIQDEISLLIADKLREHFGHFEIGEHLVQKQTENITAYEYCLKAHYHKNRWNPADVVKSIEYCEKALALDSNYAEAYVGLADAYSFLGTVGYMSFEEAWGKTIQYTQQALGLNDRLSGVHYQLSNQAFFVECNYNKALHRMQRAIDLNPNNAEAQQFMSFLYVLAGNQQMAKKHLNVSFAINPLSEESQFFNGYFHYMVGDYEHALDLLNKCLEHNDKNVPAHSVKPLCLLKQGKYQEVLHYHDNVPKEALIEQEALGTKAMANALLGNEKELRALRKQLEEFAQSPDGFTANSYLFMLHVVMGDFDKAFEWVQTSLENNSPLLALRYADPVLSELRKDKRYEQYHAQIFKTEAVKPEKKKKELLDAQASKQYADKLTDYLKTEQPYLDSSLSLRSLAAQIDIHPNQLSWLINTAFGKNFNELINHYRIEVFKSIAKDPKNDHLTIEGLAYESGFNSKTVFNTYFKKETGLTPKQFLKS